jgi:hypothetical protein
MPEVVRSIAARLRKFFRDRRHTPRCRVQLPLTVSLFNDRLAASARQSNALNGHTLDLSKHGLAVLVPAIRIGDQYLAGEGRGLRLALQLPTGPVVIEGAAVRYERLDEAESETGYLIGVKITALSDPDRATYEEYVDGLLSK